MDRTSGGFGLAVQASREDRQELLIPINMPGLWLRSQVIAVFGVLLYRYQGQENVTFEIAAERDGKPSRDSIELDFTQDPSFSALVAKLEMT